MSQEYYAIENKANVGELNIGLQVIEVIVKEAVEKIEGASLEGTNALSMKSKGPIIVKINKNNQVNVNLDIVVDYGINVGTISNAIQTKISTALYEMLEIKNAMINVKIQRINF